MRSFLLLYVFLGWSSVMMTQQTPEKESPTGFKKWTQGLSEKVDSLRLGDKIKDKTKILAASSAEARARRQLARDKPGEAVVSYQNAALQYRELGDSLGVARSFNEIARIYNHLGDREKARQYFQLAGTAAGRPVTYPAIRPKPEGVSALPTPPKEASSKPDSSVPVVEETSSSAHTTNRDSVPNQAPNRQPISFTPTPSPNQQIQQQYEKLLSQLDEVREDSIMMALLVESQQDKLQIMQQDKDLAEAQLQIQQERQSRIFRTFLISGISALLLMIVLYRQYLVRRKAHRRTQEAYHQLAEAHQKLKSAQTQLVESEKMASLGQLTAGIAHEINNPVNFISGNITPLRQDLADLLELLNRYEQQVQTSQLHDQFEEVLDFQEEIDLSYIRKEVDELMNGISEGASRTAEIVRGLRDFSRLDENERKPFDIHLGLDSSLTLLRNATKERITIEKEYGVIPEIDGFPGKLNQVFMNILNNAIQAIEGEGKITIRTGRSGDKVFISIRDTGKGIPEDIQSKIFEPFFTTKKVGDGTGLGLAISQGIVEQHNGSIEVKSEEGKGTEFRIVLPVSES